MVRSKSLKQLEKATELLTTLEVQFSFSMVD